MNIAKRWLIAILFVATHLSANEITIAVAANVSYAIDELVEVFHQDHPDTKVRVILGSSGKLAAQISHGAPYGILMSANMAYPYRLYKSHIAISEPVVYAKGALAILSIKKVDISKSLELLKEPSIHKIAMGNPKTAPYGEATLEALKNAKIYSAIKSKLIYGESISQTLSYTITAADIGIVAKSALYSSQLKSYKEGINWISIDNSLYTPISQGIVLLKYGEKDPSYRLFYDYILSRKGKEILQRYGYSTI
ncbi:Molybdenum ABC transporter, periplasmic molybdenum-binding protein ModA (TC 3.A.1.8.1) [hydrothermal vent metagenome]|uniref:Molybdenum ABC transporter, periplasmic molybdenum-binding protein ModA (TC 3.A.1.8.1) n=1 Tax=hydrothermal vent metagenome TaxID=652676 RepID=A0A1W1B8X8_9ZZZZ